MPTGPTSATSGAREDPRARHAFLSWGLRRSAASASLVPPRVVAVSQERTHGRRDPARATHGRLPRAGYRLLSLSNLKIFRPTRCASPEERDLWRWGGRCIFWLL